MIKVVDGEKEYYYDTPSDVWEDYPEADIHAGIVIIREQAKA